MQSFWRVSKTFLGLILRRPIVGVSVIPVMPDQTILLMRRRDTQQWGLPGGLVDWGETVEMAARRELWEETGVRLTGLGRLVGVYSSLKRDYRFHSVCVAIEAYVEGTPTIADSIEVMEVVTLPLADVLMLPLSHDHAQQLQDYAHNRTCIS